MAAKAAVGATVRAVSRKRLTPQRAPLVLTNAAVEKIKGLLQEKPDVLGLKVGVRTRGCNGLSYTLDYVKEKGKFDEEVVQDGVKVFIDSKAQLSLLGTEMDYVESKLNSEFIFNNPNIKGTCGCGVKVFIDSKAQLSLLGTEMDYVESKLNSEFIFNNPNIKGTCGCGESFSV